MVANHYPDPFDPVPVPQFEGDSLLERVARAYEAAVDEAGKAYDAEALTENEYLRLHATAYAHAVEDGIAATKRGEWCDNQKDVCEARQDWNRAIATRKRCVDKARELEHRQVAIMSHNRFMREGSGG